MKRGVRKLRKDSLLSNFSSHVVFGQQNILGKICSLTKLIQEFAPKAVQTEFAVRNAFEREAIFD